MLTPATDSGRLPRPSWRALLRLLLGLTLVALIADRSDFSHMTVRWSGRLAAAVALATVLILAAQTLSALRWRVILGPRAPRGFALARLYLIGSFFSLFLPTSVGGDAVRTVLAGRATGRLVESASSVLLDRLFGFGALVAYLVLGLIVAPDVLGRVGGTLAWGPAGGVWWMLLGVLGLAGVGTVLWRRVRAVRAAMRDVVDQISRLARSPATLLRAAGLALLVQAAYITAWIVLASGLRFGLSWSMFLVAVPIVSLSAMLPLTLSGLGLREGAWLLLLRPYDLAAADVVTFSLLYFAGLVLVGGLGGVLWVTHGGSVVSDGYPAAAAVDSSVR